MTDPPTTTVWEDATHHLSADPAFGDLVRRVGPVRVSADTAEPFVYLVRAIVYQQLAGAAARTIHGRVVEALGGEVNAATLLDTPDATLRGAGLSAAKLAALRDLASRSASGDVDLGIASLEALSDEQVVERLTRVRGIGPWTAQMFLMFRLHRPDVWPVLDLGVRNGWARVHALDASPDARALEPLGEPYRPWRSAAAWYCWRALEAPDSD